MSTRPISSAVQTAVNQPQITPLLFIELDFGSGFLRLTTAGHDVRWNGLDWLGVGMIGNIEPISEGTDLSARGFRMSLSGVDSAIIAIALQQDYQGRAARIWCAFINDLGAIVADPIGPWFYRMDHMEVSDGQYATVVLQVESEFAGWDRPRIRRFSDADQKSIYPYDKGFEFVTEAAARVISWGRG